jgi:hypothetical protein
LFVKCMLLAFSINSVSLLNCILWQAICILFLFLRRLSAYATKTN